MKYILSALVLVAAFASCAPKTDLVSKANVRNTPVLALKGVNDIASIELSSVTDTSYNICGVSLALGSTCGLEDISKVSILSGDREVAAVDTRIEGKRADIRIPCEIPVRGQRASFGIGITTADAVNLDNKIVIGGVKVITSSGTFDSELTGAAQLRMGVALRMWGQDGVDNCRIPGLAVTPKGTILAIYDARRGRNADLQGDIDICYNRSTDGGRTWSGMKIAMDMGEWGGLPQKFNGVSDPCILVDDKTGDIFVSACWMHGVIDPKTGEWVGGLTEESGEWNHQWRKNGSLPGYDVHQSCQWMVVKSTDDGLTWSEPMNFTRQVKPEDYCLMINAPGAGIVLEDGTFVIPAQGKREDETHFSTLITSRDGGRTWSAGTPVIEDHSIHSNECMAVQLSDGSIMLNMRSNKNRGNHERNGRMVYVTKDLGQTWTEHPTSGHVLTEPTCQGSLLKHMYEDAEGREHELLLFFNPNDPDEREHYTMKCSLDEGMTWPEDMWLEVDEYSGRGYSCMISLDNDTVGVLYEGSGACMVYQRIKLEDLVKI